MRTIEIKLYSFNELSEAAKKVAIRDHETINVDFDWWKWTYEDAENVGLKITGFNDYSCSIEFEDTAERVADSILSDHGKTCGTYIAAKWFKSEYEALKAHYNENVEDNHSEYEDKATKLERIFLDSLQANYKKLLCDEYDYLQSSEAIADTIINNEYEFLESGKKY